MRDFLLTVTRLVVHLPGQFARGRISANWCSAVQKRLPS
jgi:hypothetical protein